MEIKEKDGNWLYMSNDCIEFRGFNKVDDIVTFCFYPAGIVIMTKPPENKKGIHFIAIVDYNKKIYDLNIIKKLKKRGLESVTEFLEHANTYYEVRPHSINEF